MATSAVDAIRALAWAATPRAIERVRAIGGDHGERHGEQHGEQHVGRDDRVID